jgi:hypothetical protein
MRLKREKIVKTTKSQNVAAAAPGVALALSTAPAWLVSSKESRNRGNEDISEGLKDAKEMLTP